MNRAIARTRLRPAVDRVFARRSTRGLRATSAAAEHFGKLCIRIA